MAALTSAFSRSYPSSIPRKYGWYSFEATTGTFLVALRDDYLDPGLKFTEMQVFVTTYACLMPEKDVPVEVAIFVPQASLPLKWVSRYA